METKTSSTRDEILTMLKVQKGLTVAKMANQLNITEIAVRRHLSTLERDGLVDSTLIRQPMGRPISCYQLTDAGEETFPRNYKRLTLDFLSDISQLGGVDLMNQLFEARQSRLTKKYEKYLVNKSFDEEVIGLAKLQDENGYMVQLEKQDECTYLLKEFNCPISDVAFEYKKACECELSLFKQVLNTADVISKGCMANGDDCCQYEIKRKEG
ncbi:helix-turn-helix transcriptional regulator [Litchfieldia salsa]|uniref:Predicted transcriptional regulator, ArsR family n=1 Tax=Litchfieldia salsa TaxID=930152 RepID=A0A1H0WQE8_9BACI|nr:metalloregulator ArsR/SmtB family transcription factor [Litchfieldia salsa]SDP92841.1 Predicted transcriptional regulator, ArsR family [Litchfieldia salsa]